MFEIKSSWDGWFFFVGLICMTGNLIALLLMLVLCERCVLRGLDACIHATILRSESFDDSA